MCAADDRALGDQSNAEARVGVVDDGLPAAGFQNDVDKSAGGFVVPVVELLAAGAVGFRKDERKADEFLCHDGPVGGKSVPLLRPVSFGGRIGYKDEVVFEQCLDVQFHSGDAVNGGGAVGDDGHVVLAPSDAFDAGFAPRCREADSAFGMVFQKSFDGGLHESSRSLLATGDGDYRSVGVLSRHKPLHLIVTMHEIGDDAANSLALLGDFPAFAHQQQPRLAIWLARQPPQRGQPLGDRRLRDAKFLCRRRGVAVEFRDPDEGLEKFERDLVRHGRQVFSWQCSVFSRSILPEWILSRLADSVAHVSDAVCVSRKIQAHVRDTRNIPRAISRENVCRGIL